MTEFEPTSHPAHVPAGSKRQKFLLYLIKPSHYDDDGYVIQWMRSAIPSNSLAVLYGLAAECRDRGALGDVDLDILPFDETNTRIRPERIAREIKAAGGHGMVALVGVQSNQFPRSLDLARKLRALGVQVGIGGFHVSGCTAMLPEMPDDMKEALAMGVSLFAGEAEGRMEMVLTDAIAGKLKPIYNFMNDLPGLEGAPVPLMPAHRVSRTGGAAVELRRRARLPVPVLVLHHHQCPGPQIALPLRRRCRGDHPHQSGAGGEQLLHHRRQSGAQQELGADLRPPDPPARGRGASVPLRHSGRHALPPHPQLHPEGGAGRREARLPRAREHQPGQPCRGEEEAEPHLRISRDAAGVEEGPLLHLCRLHSRLSRRHAGDDRPRHQDHPARTAARSPRILLPDAAAGLRGPQEAARHPASGWTRT